MKHVPMDDPEFSDDGGPLFARSRTNDPGTSKAAAASLSSEMLGDMHRRILEKLRATPGGLTSRQLAMACGFERDSVSPRMPWLVEHNAVRDSGEVRPSDGDKGRKAIVWVAT